jgi:hypothetical protein
MPTPSDSDLNPEPIGGAVAALRALSKEMERYSIANTVKRLAPEQVERLSAAHAAQRMAEQLIQFLAVEFVEDIEGYLGDVTENE